MFVVIFTRFDGDGRCDHYIYDSVIGLEETKDQALDLAHKYIKTFEHDYRVEQREEDGDLILDLFHEDDRDPMDAIIITQPRNPDLG